MRVIRRNIFKPVAYFAIFSALALGWYYFYQLKRELSFENIISFIGYVSFGTTIIWQLWDRWLWHWPLLRKISRVPNFSGRWIGTYQRFGSDSDGRRHSYVLEIRQTFSSICCSTYQDNGTSSAAVIAEVCDFADERACVVFFWEGISQSTETSQRLKQIQEEYRGLTKLTFSPPKGSKHAALDGEYFTNRETRGEVHVERMGQKLLQRFR